MTWLARAVFVLLVGATFASFFVAQRLKGAPPVVEVQGLTAFFSPNADGRRDGNSFAVRLEQSERVTVDVVDAVGERVRRLASDAPVASERPLRLRWDGRSDDAAVVPDGPYRLRVNLLREGRSVEVPATTNVDTTPPRPRVVRVDPGQLVGPRAPRLRIGVRRISFRFRTRFRILRTDDGTARVVARFSSRPGVRHGTWDGRADGVPAPAGVYLVRVSARDRAGNFGTTPAQLPPRPGDLLGSPGITVRGIAAQPPLRPVTAGSRAEFFVDSRRRPYAWRIRRAGRSRTLERGRVTAGEARPLTLRAPTGASGLYLLQLRAGGDRTAVPFTVQAARRADVLVVVPAITWLGADQVDDGPRLDGLPNTLPAGGPVKWPRVFAGKTGLPRDFDQMAPLLDFLDRAHVRYDLTTDLDLAVSGIGPRASDRKGVLLAGPQRWITRGLARRLRRYAADGGTVASFGVDTLRRGVTVRANVEGTAGSLLRPTQPTAQDPFGARLEPLRRSRDGSVPLQLLAGDASFGLLTGFDGQGLEGFDVFEPSKAPEPGSRGRLLVGIGTQPAPAGDEAGEEALAPEPVYALTAARVGEGVVIRVGLPQWATRLRQPDVRQITNNIVDLLRGVKPRLRSRP